MFMPAYKTYSKKFIYDRYHNIFLRYMRKPFLMDSSEFVLEPTEGSATNAAQGLDRTTLTISEDMTVSTIEEGLSNNNRLKWIVEPKLGERNVMFQIQNYPISDDPLVKESGEQILSETELSEYDIKRVETDNQKILNPVMYGDFFIETMEDIGFEIENINDSRIGRNSEIGDIVVKNGNLKFSDKFKTPRFNSKMMKMLVKEAKESIGTVENPYKNMFSLKSLSPFFAKHEEKGAKFWSMYKDRLFTENPVKDRSTYLDQIIDNEVDRFDKFVMWNDLVSNIRFELVDMNNDRVREVCKRRISDAIGVNHTDIRFPWRQDGYEWVMDNILTKYKKTDFGYEKDCLTPDSLIKISDDDIDYVFRVLKYGRCSDVVGTLVPKGWLVKLVATTPRETNTQVGREELYKSLKMSNSCRYLTKDEISSCEMCTEDSMKPVVRTDDPYSETYNELRQKEQHEERIKNCIQDGYKMKRVKLLDIIDNEALVFGYDGWHTGTVCPEFPLKISIDKGKSYSEYSDFNQDGVVSYKSKCRARIKPDWDMIVGEGNEQDLVGSNYTGEEKLVIVVHNLP